MKQEWKEKERKKESVRGIGKPVREEKKALPGQTRLPQKKAHEMKPGVSVKLRPN
jgi:hypothetical protein